MTHNWNNKREVRQLTGRPWRRLREQIMRRDTYLCQTCKRSGRVKEADQVDHIVALANGGTDKPDNLEAICAECHVQKTRMDSGRTRKVEIGVDGFPVAARIAARNKPGSHWSR